MSTITKERLEELATGRSGFNLRIATSEESMELARIALASLEADKHGRNPVLAYADSYRDMAKQGVESIPVWAVIADLERNIAPLFAELEALQNKPVMFIDGDISPADAEKLAAVIGELRVASCADG